MTVGLTHDWYEANQDYLVAVLAESRGYLQQYSAPDHPISQSSEEIQSQLQTALLALPSPAALDVLCNAFSLSSFERQLLVLCAGVELDAEFARLCATAQDHSQLTYPTFGLAMAVFPDPHWSALIPTAPLRHWRLIEVCPGETLTTSRLRITERVLHYLAGTDYPEEALQGMMGMVYPPDLLPDSQQQLVDQVEMLWSQAAAGWPAIHLCGQAAVDARAIAAAASAAVGLRLSRIRSRHIPLNQTDREELIRLWEREAILRDSALLVEWNGQETAEQREAATDLMNRLQGALLVSSQDVLPEYDRPLIRLDVAKPKTAEQSQLWRIALGDIGESLNGQLDHLVGQFDLSTTAITSISQAVLVDQNGASPSPEIRLWQACRDQSRTRLDDLAQRIEPIATWDELVLPDQQIQTLQEVVAHVRQRAKVYDQWGFASRSARGLGISALFAGASGTGKTMAAEVLANALQLDLHRIDLSAVVSKYIGETEKNLRRVFDAAEAGGSVLLFDEADALFGKRSEVKDSHDRYANIEVSYLLQRMEAYRGLAILTTNLKDALDRAFMRRIRFIVHFPFPEAHQRAEIWRRIYPVHTPTQNLDVDKLSRLNVSGGNIRNIALNAAFLAADANESVQMGHILRAAQSEYTKLERPLTDQEVEGWVT